MTKNLVDWKVMSPIIADVVISPWNLLIGGLLISKLSFPSAVLSIILGYTILSIIFYYYGGLGFHFRKNTSQLIEPIFGNKGTRVFFSLLLAFGQIGWFSIINQLGGESLSKLTNLPTWLGIIIYAFSMFLIATLNLYKLSIIKSIVTISSLALIIYLFIVNYPNISFSQMLSDTGGEENLIWGISVIVASLMSFCSVSPDFTAKVSTKKDLLSIIITGLFLPGVFMATLGSVLFFGKNHLSLELIISLSSLAYFGHLFNVLTNTDASVALFTPGNRLNYAFKIPFSAAVAIATIIGAALSLMNIRTEIEIWLSIIAGIYPSLVGVTIAYYSMKLFRQHRVTKFDTDWRAISIILFSSTLIFFINISLLNWIVAFSSFILYIAMTGVTIKIYIGEDNAK